MMEVLRFVGFGLIAIMVVIGLDYYQQDKKTDSTLSFNGYVETVYDRFDLYQAERVAEEAEAERQKRWKAGGKAYLPAASGEWSRRAIVDADFTVDAKTGQKQANASDAARPLAIKVAVQDATVLAKKLDRTSWVYENGDHTIWLHVTLANKANTNTLAGNVAQSIAAMNFSNSSYIPFGVIGGVAYFEAVQDEYYDVSKRTRSIWAMVKSEPAETGVLVSFDTYTATIGIGQEIRLLARSDAPAEDVRAFLGRLDYDGLNALLLQPVPTVGNEMQIDPAREAELAVEMAELRTEFVNLRAEIARMRINNLDGLSLVANTLAGQYGLPNDTFDLTANNIATPADLIQVGYRKGLSDLMVQDTEEAKSEGADGLFGGILANFKGDEQAAPEKESKGLFSGFKSFFQKTDTASADGSAAKPAEVRVNKGGSGSLSECSTKGAFKKCSFSGG